METSAKLATIRKLQEKVRLMEDRRSGPEADVVRSGTAIDSLLPDRGWKRGSLTEWLGEGEGSGALTVALAQCGSLMRQASVLVVIDSVRNFYPPAAQALGVDLAHTVLVQPGTSAESLWAFEQAVRSPTGALVLGWFDRLEERSYRRLQLAAETGGSLGMIVRPRGNPGEPSWAAVRLLVTPRLTESSSPVRRWGVEVLHYRGGRGGGSAEVELTDDGELVRAGSASGFAVRAVGA